MNPTELVNKIFKDLEDKPKSLSDDKVFYQYQRKVEYFYRLLFETLYEFDWQYYSEFKVLNCSNQIRTETFSLFLASRRIKVTGEETIKIDGSMSYYIEIVILGPVKEPIFINKFYYDQDEFGNVAVVVDKYNSKFYDSTYIFFMELQGIQYDKMEDGLNPSS